MDRGHEGGDVYFDENGSTNHFYPGESALLPVAESEAEAVQRQAFGNVLAEGLGMPENLASDARLQRVLFGRLVVDGEAWRGAAQELMGAAGSGTDLEEALEYRKYARGIQRIGALEDENAVACGVEIEYEEAPSAKGGIEKRTTRIVLDSNPIIEGSFEVIDTWREFRGAGLDRIARFDEQRMEYEASGRMYALNVTGGGNTTVREQDNFDSFPEKQVRGNTWAISGTEIIMDKPVLVEDDAAGKKYRVVAKYTPDEDVMNNGYGPTEMDIFVYEDEDPGMYLQLPDMNNIPIHMYGRPMGVAAQFIDPVAMDKIDWSGRASSLPGQWSDNGDDGSWLDSEPFPGNTWRLTDD